VEDWLMADDGVRAVTKMAGRLQISNELLAQAEEDRQAHQAWLDASPEQREQWRQEATKQRTAQRAMAAVVPLTLDALLGRLHWTRAYAEHVLQPYCGCHDYSDGWVWCDHAHDLEQELMSGP
jgi:hypothetical protein